MLRSLLGSFFRRTGSTARGPAGQRSLRLERLEERSLLSFNYPLLTVASFGPGAGAYSEAGLIVDAAGNLFGTTYAGGGNGTNNGTLFEVKAGGKRTISTLANFNFSDGSNPLGSLVEDAHGNLFGTTCYGGAGTPYGEGTIFEYSNGRITALASFEGANGANPAAGLVEDAGGNLFGTTSKGGANGDGTVFEYSTTAGTLTTLAAFNGANGACPEANLLEDASGNLFGTAESGGDYRAGTVFEIQAGSGTVTTLGTFNDSNGCAPMGSLVAGANGNLIGTASGGGAAGAGTVFEVDLASRTITTLANFNGTNGAAPMGSLVEDANGNLFGATQHGGTGGFPGAAWLRAPPGIYTAQPKAARTATARCSTSRPETPSRPGFMPPSTRCPISPAPAILARPPPACTIRPRANSSSKTRIPPVRPIRPSTSARKGRAGCRSPATGAAPARSPSGFTIRPTARFT
jgi:uncharacterized repeat protein (TIGR03803 family)